VSWQILFAGYGVFPPQENTKPEIKGNDSVNIKDLDDFIRRCSSNYCSHQDSLNAIKGGVNI
jgi:hypothetical protein